MNEKTKQKKGFTIDQLTIILGVSKPTVYRMQRDNEIPVPCMPEDAQAYINGKQKQIDNMQESLDFFSSRL